MKNLLKAGLLTGVFALASCCEKPDPNMPSPYINVAPPEWTESLQVNVRKHGADVINAQGESFKIERSGTDIGGGLTAWRDQYDLYIRDTNGVECNWDSGEHLDYSRKTNPAYTAYMDSVRRMQK